MRYGLDVSIAGEFADVRQLATLAEEAEQAGWDGLFVWDILYAEGQMRSAVVDPWIALAAIALHTQRMRIGAMLTPLPRRRPWVVARQAATLDHLSGGRLVFGAGLGYQALDFTPFGEEFDLHARAERLDEALDIITGLWSGEPISLAGRHYQLTDAQMLPRPLQQPRIPIWLAVGWPRRAPLRRAARYDGVYVMTVNQVTGASISPDDVAQITSLIHAQRQRTEPFDIAIASDGPDSASPAQMAEQIARYAAAGATWWLEYDRSDSLEEYRKVVRRGPPRP